MADKEALPSLEERATIALERIATHLKAISFSISQIETNGLQVDVTDIQQPAIDSLIAARE